ncbi:hypothetical protein ACEPAF_9949 [Sanghuangporus sanghuang]
MSFVDHHPQPIQQPAEPPKKRTRRRLRVSCVECTRRRQKCDRQQPCGLCKTRGVEHLCRWETEPYARPPPARPPGRAGTRKDRQPPNVVTDWQQIPGGDASMPYAIHNSPSSQALLPWKGGISSPSSPSQASLASSISRTSLSPIHHPHEGLKEAALALARMQLTEEDHRLGEGSLAYTLQELSGSGSAARVFDIPLSAFSQSSFTVVRSSEAFIPRLPDKEHCEALLQGFHEHVNWCIGIPYHVLFQSHEAMWAQLRADPACLRRFNPNWIALLFAIFAFSPSCATEEESRNYFTQALTARKLDEDRYSSLDSPTPTPDFRGAVYTCLATAFLARYLQDRGRVAEAWRVVGSGLRDAQNAGLHRFLAPGKAKNLANDERTFMLVAWHLCVEFDRYLSLFLGRPTVLRSRDCNVQKPEVSSTVLALDGSTNTALLFQYYFISMTTTVSEAKERFLSDVPDPEDGHAYFDAKMGEWLASLPPYYKLDQPPDVSFNSIYPKLYLQRMTINSYYSCSCLLYHRALAYTKPSQNASSNGFSAAAQSQHAWDQSQLAYYAIRVLHAQTDQVVHQFWERQVPFDISMYMFEAAVTLGVTILRYAHHPRAEEWQRELVRTIQLLETLRERDYGKIVVQAIQVLRVLQDLCEEARIAKGKHRASEFANLDPAAAQEEAKVFFQMEGFSEHDEGINSSFYQHQQHQHQEQHHPSTTASNLFGNMWVPQSMPDLDTCVMGGGGSAGIPSSIPPNTPISAGPSEMYHHAGGYHASFASPIDSPTLSFDGHSHAGYPMWSTSDGFIMPNPSFSPESINLNAQYV